MKDPASIPEDASKAPPLSSQMAADADEVLHVPDVQCLLRIGRNSVYALVNRNEIPHRRLGKQIRFSRAAVMRWLSSCSLQGAKERH